MTVKKRTLKSHSYNEDRFVCGKCLFGVIDGATVLEDKPIGNSKTKASVLSAFVKKRLERYCGCDLPQYLREISVEALKSGIEDASCGISLVEVRSGKIVLYYIGDCDIFVKFKNGKVERYNQNELQPFDEKALSEQIRTARERGISVREARKYINGLLIENREKKNKKGGYDIFEPTLKPNFRASVVEIDKKEVQEIIVCTDGFSQSFKLLKLVGSYENLFDKKVDLFSLCDEINKELEKDADYNLYPRFKLKDDITVVKIEL